MKSKLVWVSVALIIATIILWVVLINRVNDDVSKLSAAIKNSIAEAAETDSLRQARLDYQFDPEKRGSFAKRFEELHENTRVWFVDEGLWQIRYAEAESWSRQLWVRALETMYSTVLSATMKDEARTRELVENMVEVTFYDYRPKRTRTVNRVIKEFGYMGEEVTEFITTTIDFGDSTAVVDTVQVSRPFQYSIFAEILPSQLTDPIHGYLKEDMSRLQTIYEDVLRRRPWLQDEAPERFEVALVLFLEKVLRECVGIDFDAELTPTNYGKMMFVNDEYEDWSGLKKVIFSMGPKGAGKVQVIARGLLDRFQPPEQE